MNACKVNPESSRNPRHLFIDFVEYVQSYLHFTGGNMMFSFTLVVDEDSVLSLVHDTDSGFRIFDGDTVIQFSTITKAVSEFIDRAHKYNILDDEIYEVLKNVVSNDVIEISNKLPPLCKCDKCKKLYRSKDGILFEKCPVCGAQVRTIPPVLHS
jgi:hypothetical protein